MVSVAANALCAILTALDNDVCRLVALQSGIIPAVDGLLTGDSIGQAWNGAVRISLFLSQGNGEVREVIASSGIVGGLCRIVMAGCDDTHPVPAVQAATLHAALATLSNVSASESEVARMAIADCGVLPILVQLVNHDAEHHAGGAQQAAGKSCRALDQPLHNTLKRKAAIILRNVSRGSHGVRMAAIDAGALKCASRTVLGAAARGEQSQPSMCMPETFRNLLHAHLDELRIRRERAREEAEEEATLRARAAA